MQKIFYKLTAELLQLIWQGNQAGFSAPALTTFKMLAIISDLGNSFLYFFVLFNKIAKIIVLCGLQKVFCISTENRIKKFWISGRSYGRSEAL
ncbi:MAG: hypothetical protein M3384_02070 [Acidobacteriota bacterium]|nr:hypothetical protein [Acidobacteriota bacterium]